MTCSRYLAHLAVLSCVCAVGCSGKSAPELAPVTVTIIYNGEPLEAVHVTLHSAAGSPAGYGQTDASGVAQVMASMDAMGVEPGAYKVTVTRRSLDNASSAKPVGQAEQNQAEPAAEDNAAVRAGDVIPDKYTTPDSTRLRIVVTDEPDDNHFTFELTD
jgi:hypothetical protein